MVGDNPVHIEIATLSGTQFEVSFWLFPNRPSGLHDVPMDALRSSSGITKRVLA